MAAAKPTIEQQIRNRFDDMTRAERQLASHITRNYPVAALGSITALAKGADVSTPTVVRLVQKLGYKGYPDFQIIVRAEVEERLISPLTKHERWAGGVPDTHMLNRFADSVVGNLQATLSQVDHAECGADGRQDPQDFCHGGADNPFRGRLFHHPYEGHSPECVLDFRPIQRLAARFDRPCAR